MSKPNYLDGMDLDSDGRDLVDLETGEVVAVANTEDAAAAIAARLRVHADLLAALEEIDAGLRFQHGRYVDTDGQIAYLLGVTRAAIEKAEPAA